MSQFDVKATTRFRAAIFGLAIGLLLPTNALVFSAPIQQAANNDKGTDSPKAIALFEEATKLHKRKKFKESVAKLKLAMKEDPEFQLGLYWLALNSSELKKYDDEAEYYEQLYQLGKAQPDKVVAVDGCINAGLSYGRRKQLEKSERWFSRAVMLDPNNVYGLGARTYRNLAITKLNKQDYSSATLSAMLGNRLDTKTVPDNMVQDLGKRMNSEVATILSLDDETDREFEYLDNLGETGEPVLHDLGGDVAQLINLGTLNKMLAVFKDAKFVELLDFDDLSQIERIELKGKPKGACYVDGRLFLTVSGPNRLVELDLETGKEIAIWKLKQSAPLHFAVAPKHDMAFFPGTSMQILNLKTGKISNGPNGITSLRCDPSQQHVFAFWTPRYRPNEESGMFLIRGRPIHYTIRGQTGNQQSVLMRFKICDGGVALAQARFNAASNGKQMVVSDDGAVVAMVGGGAGVRPMIPWSKGMGLCSTMPTTSARYFGLSRPEPIRQLPRSTRQTIGL